MYLERSGKVLQHKLARVNLSAEGVVGTEFSVDCYNISVVDWEEDGSISPMNVPAGVDVGLQTQCGVQYSVHEGELGIDIAVMCRIAACISAPISAYFCTRMCSHAPTHVAHVYAHYCLCLKSNNTFNNSTCLYMRSMQYLH